MPTSILIVDDEPMIREALSRWFELRGFAVSVAENGEAAVDLCRTNSFDAVTMDLEMPRMGGVTAIQAIRETLGDHVPVIVLTGYPRNADMALAAGAAKVLVKPIRLRELEGEIVEILAQHRARASE